MISAPTGSGKTLTAFLWSLNRLISKPELSGAIRVLYVSPLKALNNDIQRNLLTPLEALEQVFYENGLNFPVIRVMPNTPATVGAAMTAIASGTQVQSSHLTLATSLFEAVGEVVEVPESLMDGVTGLSGSGPAFVALMIEALSDGGVASGLPRAIATKLAIQTVLGTATLIKETGLHPGQLKDNVTSPGGTTIAGVAKLEEKGFRSAVIEAVKMAYRRSQELGK